MKRYFVFISCAALAYSCATNTQQQVQTVYETIKLESSERVLNSEYAASITGKHLVEIRPQVSGTITEIMINEGDRVKKGQVLFVIDQVPYKAALETAKANVSTAEAKLATARLTVEGKTNLHREGVVSEYDLNMSRNSLSEAEAALEQAKAEYIKAENELSYTEVTSPVDGYASMIPYRVGALVSSSIAEPLVTVSDDSEVYAYFSLPENEVLDMVQSYGSLDKALLSVPEVELMMSNQEIYNHKGKIDAISGFIDQSTGTVSVRAVFRNPDGWLRNGASGVVRIPSVHKDCIVIPQASTYDIQNKTFVYKVVDGVTKSQEVSVSKISNGKEYIVESGLDVGDVIIAAGAGLLRDGIRIQEQ